MGTRITLAACWRCRILRTAAGEPTERMTTIDIGGTLSVDRPDAMAIDRIARGGFELLQLVNGGEEWSTLEFLAPHRQKVRRLRISGLFKRFTGLDQLTELAELDLGDAPPDPMRDFSALCKLESCKLAWTSKILAETFFALPRLSKLFLLRYRHTDCSQIGLAGQLKVLELTQPRLSSLGGLDGCTSLEALKMIQVRGLFSLDGIERCPSLRVLDIEQGSAFKDAAGSLQRCSSLEEVLLDGNFEISNLGWMRSNPRIAKFRTDAVVLDVDWHVLFGLPGLHEIAIRHVPGALRSDDDIKEIARSFGKQVQWIEHGGTRRAPWVEVHFRPWFRHSATTRLGTQRSGG